MYLVKSKANFNVQSENFLKITENKYAGFKFDKKRDTVELNRLSSTTSLCPNSIIREQCPNIMNLSRVLNPPKTGFN